MRPLISSAILLIMAIISKRQLSHNSLNSRNKWDKRYDFIVVGGGTAGSVVAARLAENAKYKVLLIEAGGPQNIDSDIPAFASKLIGTELDWNYPIMPQKNAYFNYPNNQRNISRGKAFGGCSMHNSMNYYWENPEFYQFWTDITGVKKWTFADVLPYFKKSENNLDKELVKNNPDIHKTGGPLTITTANYTDPLMTAYLEASQLMGYPLTYPDGRNPFGSTVMQRNIKDGVRQTTSLVFLENNNRKNLHILGKTLVTKVLFNKKKRAIGVQFYRNNKFYQVFAKKEVIISAGAIGSPQLLMLSGIGPKWHLVEKGLKVISNVKVGRFVYSPNVGISFEVKDQSLVEKQSESFDNYYNYFVHGQGPLSYISSGVTCFPQVHYPGRSNLSNGFFLVRDGISKQGIALINVYMGLKKPQSVGTIRLASKDPLEYPLIDPCVFCQQSDLTDFVKTFKLTLDIFLSPVLKPFIEIIREPNRCEPCPNDYFCDSYIRCYIQSFTGPTYPMGGCRIGVATDKHTVVDQTLKVLGVSGLRVIDSSIFPVATDQSFAITIMIGEYGADLIKRDNPL